MKTLRRTFMFLMVSAISVLPQTTSRNLPEQSPASISLQDRVLIATKIYHQVATFYPEFSQGQFDKAYSGYLSQVLDASIDRRTFDFASMALVATLRDGHTWFYDDWLDKNEGQPTGLTVYSRDGHWVVVNSELDSVHVGDVIERIDGISTQQFFEDKRKYISGSSDRDQTTSLFDTPVVFPQRFTLTLDGGRQVTVDREHYKKTASSPATEGKWLIPGSVAYIKVPNFRGIRTQAAALDDLDQFHDAKTVILDVRGNPGLGNPLPLQRSLFDAPYQMWVEFSSMKGGSLLRQYEGYAEMSHITTGDATVRPEGRAYAGRLFLLIDRGCVCACENFVMPFKTAGRAKLFGETTAGTYSSTNFSRFDNGMILNISSIRHVFPDGSRFEGVGIAPDVAIEPTARDLKEGKDVVLDRALAMATKE
jgi:carboxyl-terminal processing protease